LVNYNNCYLNIGDELNDLTRIFGDHFEQSSSQIKVTTKDDGSCAHSGSRSQIFKQANYNGYVYSTWLKQMTYPQGSNGLPSVTIEIKSGYHSDWNGGKGFVIWSKTLPTNPYAPYQNGHFTGKYKSTTATTSIVYKDGTFREISLRPLK
jgi:hypothetical protein